LSFYILNRFFCVLSTERDGRGEFAEKDGAIPENFARRFAPPRPNLKIRNIIRGRRAAARRGGGSDGASAAVSVRRSRRVDENKKMSTKMVENVLHLRAGRIQSNKPTKKSVANSAKT
jgi:hypothetical protein